MKNNFDIKVNPPKLGSDDINKHKNFDALLEQFQQAGGAEGGKELPLPNSGRFFVKYIVGGTLAVAASIALILVFRGMFDSGNGSSGVLALQSPFENIEKSFVNFELDAEKGDTLRPSSGSTIIIPASAFVDKSGKAINGKVDIQYREFDDPIDMFIAGVPQKIENQHLQTAAVMQIQGFKDGEPVYINKDRKLKMELKSAVSGNLPIDDLKVYAYTASQKDWKYKMDDQVELLDEIGKLENPVDTIEFIDNGNGSKTKAEFLVQLEQKHAMPIKPIKPAKLSANMQPFDIEVDTRDFPELAPYGEIVWVADKSKLKDEWFEIEWNSMKVQRKGDLKYQIVFSTESQQVIVEAAPIVPFNKKARKDYEKAMLAFNHAVQVRSNKIDAGLKAWEQTGGANWANREDNPKNTSDRVVLRQIINRFEIEQFGLWNCANPINLEDIPSTEAKFMAAYGGEVAVKDIFVADQNRHLYYSSKINEKLHFDISNKEAQLWVIDDNQQLWVATPNPIKEGEKTRFILQPAADIRTEADIRKVLLF